MMSQQQEVPPDITGQLAALSFLYTRKRESLQGLRMQTAIRSQNSAVVEHQPGAFSSWARPPPASDLKAPGLGEGQLDAHCC